MASGWIPRRSRRGIPTFPWMFPHSQNAFGRLRGRRGRNWGKNLQNYGIFSLSLWKWGKKWEEWGSCSLSMWEWGICWDEELGIPRFLPFLGVWYPSWAPKMFCAFQAFSGKHPSLCQDFFPGIKHDLCWDEKSWENPGCNQGIKIPGRSMKLQIKQEKNRWKSQRKKSWE